MAVSAAPPSVRCGHLVRVVVGALVGALLAACSSVSDAPDDEGAGREVADGSATSSLPSSVASSTTSVSSVTTSGSSAATDGSTTTDEAPETAEPSAVDESSRAATEGASEFVETFDTPESLDRFDYAVHHAWIANETDDVWVGDHDLDCGPPEPGRTIANPTSVDDGKTYYPGMRDPVVFWCREHMMTTFNSDHYAQVDFSPKQIFEGVSRICWNQNRTDVGSRMWTQVAVVPLDTFEANDERFDYVASRLKKNGPGAFGIHPTDETFMIELTDGGSRAQTGQFVDDNSSGNWVTSDKKTRYQVCVDDLENHNVRMEMEHDTGVQVRTLEGSIPDGPVRVVFQHDLYNPDKDEGVANGLTWHWDDIIIEHA